MILIIPCAGYGTRLQSVSGNVHKSLIDIAGKPLLSRIIGNLKPLNPEKIIIVTNDRFNDQFIAWKNKNNEDVVLINDGTRSNEERLGATADIYLGLGDHNREFMVYLGDNLLLGDLSKPIEKFISGNSSIVMLYDVKNVHEAKRFGVVQIGNNGKILNVEEKPEHPKSTLVSTGIYFFKPEIKQEMKKYIDDPANPEAFGCFLGYVYNNHKVHGYVLDESAEWIDIGSPESLEKARRLLKV